MYSLYEISHVLAPRRTRTATSFWRWEDGPQNMVNPPTVPGIAGRPFSVSSLSAKAQKYLGNYCEVVHTSVYHSFCLSVCLSVSVCLWDNIVNCETCRYHRSGGLALSRGACLVASRLELAAVVFLAAGPCWPALF